MRIFARNPIIWIIGVLLFVLIITTSSPTDLIFYGIEPMNWSIFTISAMITILLYFIGVMIILATVMLLRIMTHKDTFKKEIEYSFDNEKIVTKSKDVKSEYPWNSVRKIRETTSGLFLTLKLIHAPTFFIPKRAFSRNEDLQRFIALVKEKGF